MRLRPFNHPVAADPATAALSNLNGQWRGAAGPDRWAPDRMRRLITRVLLGIGIGISAVWLVAYGRAVWRDPECLDSMSIKLYTVVDEQTGQMSATKVDWFSVSDGPTGIVYAQRYFPCWIVSFGALALLAFCMLGLWKCSATYDRANVELS